MGKINKIELSIILTCTCIFISCVRKNNAKCESADKIGNYVYIDTQGVLHSDKNCVALILLDNRGVEFVETQKLQQVHLKSLCSKCIEDRDYELLKKVVEKNKINSDDVSVLYNRLLSKGYEVSDIGTEEIFRNKLSKKENRKILYDYIIKRGDFKIGSYEQYEERISRCFDDGKK